MIKLRVQHEDGEIAELELSWPIEIVPANATLWRMKDANGIEHFFTEEGYYDGFGRALAPEDRDLVEGISDYLNGRTVSFEEVKERLLKPTVH